MENPPSEPAVLFSTPSPGEAECLRQALLAHNIPCHILNANANTMIGMGYAVGIRVLVPGECLEDAKEVLKDFFSDTNAPLEPC